MAKKHLKREPYNLHEHVWMYEENAGLLIVAEVRSGKTEQLMIPIRKIRGYIQRKDTPTISSDTQP